MAEWPRSGPYLRALAEWGFDSRLATRFAILGRNLFASPGARASFLCYCGVVVIFLPLFSRNWESDLSSERVFLRCRTTVALFVDTCTNKSDCSGGLRGSRTDCLLFIEALGSTRSCGQHGYLAATHHPPRWRIIRVHSNPIRIRFADTVLDSIRIRLVFARDTWTRAQH
jgi:hypothetical protein